MIHKCAYVFAVIHTPTCRVEKVLILSDEQPAVDNPLKAYTLLIKTQGRTYIEARRRANDVLESSPYYRWANDLLGN